MPHLSPYSRPPALAKLDGRTREARMMQKVRADLTAHVGGQPSATQRTLIERAAQITLRIAMMDRKFGATGAQTEHDSRTYLAWSGSLSRLMRELGPYTPPPAPPAPTLAEILAQHASDNRSAA